MHENFTKCNIKKIMSEMREATFSFGNNLNADECNLDEEMVNEGWKAKDVQKISKLNENMNNLRISKRVVLRRVTEKSSACNLRRCGLINVEIDNDEEKKQIKESSKIISTEKKTLKEEIHDLLMCWAEERKMSELNSSQENRLKYRDHAKKAKSQTINHTNEDFITMKEIPPLK